MSRYLTELKIKATAEISNQNQTLVTQWWDKLWALSPLEKNHFDPWELAPRLELEPEKALAFFLYGSKANLFQMRWSVVCPTCGVVSHTCLKMDELPVERFRCGLCENDEELDLDRHIQVSFSPSLDIFTDREEPYSGGIDEYNAFFVSPQFQQSTEVKAFLSENLVSFSILKPYEMSNLPLQSDGGEIFKIFNNETQTVFLLRIRHNLANRTNSFLSRMHSYKVEREEQIRAESGMPSMGPPPQVFDLELGDEGFAQEFGRLQNGRVALWLENKTNRFMTVMVSRYKKREFRELQREFPATFKPFLTGKNVLVHQLYRDLFLDTPLNSDFHLKVGNFAVLICDVKGSTDIFTDLGDREGYQLIRNFFDLVNDAASSNGGSLIKTLGDSVMAAFSSPAEAVRASLMISEAIQRFNKDTDRLPLPFSMGLGSGNAMAVAANRAVDFVGQMLNLTIRLQKQAHEGEIWVSQSIFAGTGVVDLFHDNGWNCTQHVIKLRGDGHKSIVYQCQLPVIVEVPETPALQLEDVSEDMFE